MKTKEELREQLSLLTTLNKSILTVVDEVENIRLNIEDEELLIWFVNAVRERVQREAKWAVIDNGGKGLVAMATGSGKSKVAIDLVSFYRESNFLPNALIVPTEKLRDENWHEEFKKWNAESLYEGTNRLCYASASKERIGSINTAILDECHNITELSATFFNLNGINNIIALTATVPKDEGKLKLLETIGCKVVYELTLDDAVKLGFVAPYKINVVFTELGTENNILSGNKANPFYQSEKKKYEWLDKKWKDEKEQLGYAKQATTMMRMRFIYNLPSKTAAGRNILHNLIPETDRTLLFCGSIEQAEAVCSHRFHSKTKDVDYNAFKRGDLNRLSCVNSINEGHNFEGIDSMVLWQIQAGDKNLLQRIGRGIRFRPGHENDVWIIVARGTQDEIWLKSATENLDQSKIEYFEYSELQKQFV